MRNEKVTCDGCEADLMTRRREPTPMVDADLYGEEKANG